jgi:IS5 family transposase
MAKEMMRADDFFRSRLEQMIDLRHPLAVLAKRMPWERIEAVLVPVFAHKSRAGKVIEEENLFGTALEASGGRSPRGRPSALADPADGIPALFEARLQRQK